MLVAPAYEGLDLPVHNAETFVATREHLCTPERFQKYAVQDGSASSFVRAVLIDLIRPAYSRAPNSAAELIKKTEEELETVAELCGSIVVKHEWGLYPVEDKGRDYQKYLPDALGIGGFIRLPEDHILVAEVELVKDAVTLSESGAESETLRGRIADVQTGIDKYYEEGRGEYQLYDMYCCGPRMNQFVFGTCEASPDSQTWLVDIEPRFNVTSDNRLYLKR